MAENISWTGQSGHSYSFEVDPVGTSYKPRSGVYVFCVKKNGIYYALYVGETHNFDERLNAGLKQHDAWPCVSRRGCTHIGTMHVTGGLTARETIETDLRHGTNAPCNRQ